MSWQDFDDMTAAKDRQDVAGDAGANSATNPRPARVYRHSNLRRMVLDAAERVLSAEGRRALTLRAVAREAGVSCAAPYLHFADKMELLDTLAEAGWRSLAARLTAAVADGPTDATLAAGAAYIAFAQEHTELFRIMCEVTGGERARPATIEAWEDAWRAMLGPNTDGELAELDVPKLLGCCVIHALADISRFRQFDAVKARLGGDAPLLAALLAGLQAAGSPVGPRAADGLPAQWSS